MTTNQICDAYQELLDDHKLERACLETNASKIQNENEVLQRYFDELDNAVKSLRKKMEPHKAALEDELRWMEEERKYLSRNRYFFYL